MNGPDKSILVFLESGSFSMLFEGENFGPPGNPRNAMRVFYGTQAAPLAWPCEIDTNLTTQKAILCYSEPTSSGANMVRARPLPRPPTPCRCLLPDRRTHLSVLHSRSSPCSSVDKKWWVPTESLSLSVSVSLQRLPISASSSLLLCPFPLSCFFQLTISATLTAEPFIFAVSGCDDVGNSTGRGNSTVVRSLRLIPLFCLSVV